MDSAGILTFASFMILGILIWLILYFRRQKRAELEREAAEEMARQEAKASNAAS